MKYTELHKELVKWKNENLITQEQYEILNKRYEPEEDNILRIHNRFTSQKIIVFFMVIIVALGILSWVGEIFPWVNTIVVFASLLFISAAALYFGDVLVDKRNKTMRYTGKAIMVFGAVLFTFIFFYLDLKCKSLFGINIFGNDWSLFMLVSGVLLVFVAYYTREKAVLGYSLVLLLTWFISEIKIRTGSYTGIWLGLTFPLRIFLVSLTLLGLGYLHKNKNRIFDKINKDKKYRIFAKTYYIFGLIVGFIPIWYASVNPYWYANGGIPVKYSVLLFTILVMLFGLSCIYFGILKNSKTFFNFGVAFVALEIYGKYYQVFNNRLKSASFWIISVVIVVTITGIIEYIKDHKDEIRQELLN